MKQNLFLKILIVFNHFHVSAQSTAPGLIGTLPAQHFLLSGYKAGADYKVRFTINMFTAMSCCEILSELYFTLSISKMDGQIALCAVDHMRAALLQHLYHQLKPE